MPSPQRLYRHYSDPDLAVAFARAQKELDKAVFDSVSGGAKGGHLQVTEAKLRLHEINAEKDFREGVATPKKIRVDLSGYR